MNASAVPMSEKTYARLCGVFKTRFPDATPEEGKFSFGDGKYWYTVTAAKNGGMIVHTRHKIK